ncbi:MAG TPA: peptide-methionine (R)-S-oxide reductase MsrB [Caulobacteraceae bacterium]|nr:peptide-methionine (R)-S-oxide reductase MsrB [Caulobacteraceae bacterium]
MQMITSPRLARRGFLLGSVGLLASACSQPAAAAKTPDPNDARYANSPWRKVTDAQWKQRLSAASYRTLRHEATERAFTSPLNKEKRRGTFVCAGCELPLFRSQDKFDSGTGWPSFSRVLPGAVGTKPDLLLFQPRTEYHCARCLGHQGHIFHNEGISPTEVRYCNNGVALKFRPA